MPSAAPPATISDEAVLLDLFRVALAAALPAGKFAGRLPEAPKGRIIVLGAGKAAAVMAAAFEDDAEAAWGAASARRCEGLVVTRYGHRAPTRFVEVAEAAHPVPDEASVAAATRILALARSAGPDDLVVCLMSGGASALLALPAPGLSLADKQALTRALLKSGAPISAMNRVRKALSAVKGGRLAQAAAPVPVVTYLISDVPGDDPAAIGSGPTVPDETSAEEALSILRAYGVVVSPAVEAAIRANAPAAGVARGRIEMIAAPRLALLAAAARAQALGITPLILGDAIEGEAREVAKVMAGIARSAAAFGDPVGRPCVLLSGGETTVTVRGTGRGGRNAEFLLSLALSLDGLAGVAAIACDTDGIDGSEDNAGAWIGPGFLQNARRRGIDPTAHLSDNDAYSVFATCGRLVVTGPTLTNVNDFRAILIR